MDFNNTPQGFSYDSGQNVNIIFPSEERMRRKQSIAKDCGKMGAMLIIYHVMSDLLMYVFYLVTYAVLTKTVTLSVSEAATYLVREHYGLVTSTSFTMGLNLAATLPTLAVVLILGKAVFKADFNGFFHPEKKGFAAGARWSPACFVINMIISMMLYYVMAFLNNAGVTVPEADFTINRPSILAVVTQFLYVVVIAPIIEETLYRGVILGMISRYGKGAAVLFSALAFGLMHGNVPQAVSAFLTGILYASIAVNCGSIIPSILIHSFNNLIANFSTLANALGIPHSDMALSIIEILIGLVGVYVLMTYYRQLRYSEDRSKQELAEDRKSIFTNPVLLIYLAILIYEMVNDLIEANIRV